METFDLIPLYITAKSKDELVKNMFQNNVLHGKHFKYFEICYYEGEWVAWYYGKAGEMMNGNSETA